MPRHCGHTLAREIIALSVASEWRAAKKEWDLSSVFFSPPDDPGTCLCRHSPIREHCVLTNRENGNEVIVGNVCVKKFLDLDADELFAAFRKILKNPKAALSVKAIDHTHRKGWINDWEHAFCLDTYRKSGRKLSENQMAKRVEINTKINRYTMRREG